MTSILEKGGSGFQGIRLLLCENPLPPIEEAIAAAQAEAAHGNYYTEAYSAPLRARIILVNERSGAGAGLHEGHHGIARRQPSLR